MRRLVCPVSESRRKAGQSKRRCRAWWIGFYAWCWIQKFRQACRWVKGKDGASGGWILPGIKVEKFFHFVPKWNEAAPAIWKNTANGDIHFCKVCRSGAGCSARISAEKINHRDAWKVNPKNGGRLADGFLGEAGTGRGQIPPGMNAASVFYFVSFWNNYRHLFCQNVSRK